MNIYGNYLILLNDEEEDDEERKSWGFIGKKSVAIALGSDAKIKQWDYDKWLESLDLEVAPPWVLVFSDYSLPRDQLQKECKAKLRRLVGNGAKIWHHGGGLNYDASTTMAKVREKFRGGAMKYTVAGFDENIPLMPFSRRTAFPWQAGIDNIRETFVRKTSGKDELEGLQRAWLRAEAFLNVERPVEQLLVELFPLYVDIKSHVSNALPQEDFSASLRSWAETKDGRKPEFQEALDLIANEKVNELARLVGPLLNAVDGLTNREKVKCDAFLAAFVALSNAFTPTAGLGPI